MSALVKLPIVSEADYLKMADASEVKLELIDGVVYAMVGGTPDHATIISNIPRALAASTDARGCRGFSSDVRVKFNEYGDYFYPDSSYVCGEPEYEGISLTNPSLIVEVLSPGTELYDRKGKLPLYRAIPSVEEIVLVASDESYVERHRRHGELWTYEEARGLESTIRVLGEPVQLADLYRFIVFPPRPELGRKQ